MEETRGRPRTRVSRGTAADLCKAPSNATQSRHWRFGLEGDTVNPRYCNVKELSAEQQFARAWVGSLLTVLDNPISGSDEELNTAASELWLLAGRVTNEPESRKATDEMIRERKEHTGEHRAAIVDVVEFCKAVAGNPCETRNFEQWTIDQNKSTQTGPGVEENEEEAAESSHSDTTVRGQSNH